MDFQITDTLRLATLSACLLLGACNSARVDAEPSGGAVGDSQVDAAAQDGSTDQPNDAAGASDSDSTRDADPTAPDATVNDADEPDATPHDTDSDVSPCDGIVVTCTQGEAPVGEIVMTNPNSSPLLCAVDGLADQEPSWVWRHSDGQEYAVGFLQDGLYSFWTPRLGAGSLSLNVAECELELFQLIAGPNPEGLVVELHWLAPADADTFRGPDFDIYLRSRPDACWDDGRFVLGLRSDEAMQWPVGGRDSVEVSRTRDASGLDQQEYIYSTGIPEDAAWTLAVDVYSVSGTGPTTATVTVFINGVLEQSVSREFFSENFSEASWWVVADIDATGATLTDTLGSEPLPEECERVLCDDGRLIAPEQCNAIDDDCDGVRNEFPSACEGVNESPSECVYFPDVGEYRCVEQ